MLRRSGVRQRHDEFVGMVLDPAERVRCGGFEQCESAVTRERILEELPVGRFGQIQAQAAVVLAQQNPIRHRPPGLPHLPLAGLVQIIGADHPTGRCESGSSVPQARQ